MFTVLSLARVRGEAVASLFCVFLYQCCYSAAPVYLSTVAASNPDHGEMARAALIFMLLYFLPYVLDYAGSLSRTLWMSSSRKAFYEATYARTFGRPASAVDAEAEKSFTALISTNGQMLVADCVYFVNGATKLLFASMLSVTLISLFVVKGFVLAYFVGILLCLLLLWKFGAWQTSVAATTEKAYNRFMAVLPGGWQANALGEGAVVGSFMRVFARRWRIHRRVAFRAMKAYQSFDLAQAVCIWTPAMAVIALQLGSMGVAEIIALAIVLPRLTETLLEVSFLMGHLTDYLSLKGRVKWLNEALELPKVDLLKRCDFPYLYLARREGKEWISLDLATLENATRAFSTSGRYRLTGGNGSGKSSLLLLLKAQRRDRAFYLPAHAGLFPSFGSKVSTGQRKLHDLKRSFALVRGKVDIILLDEWDANLDAMNRQRISELIDDLSITHVIVEVSHRAGEVTARPALTS